VVILSEMVGSGRTCKWYFGAEASALSVDENQIDVNLIPSSKTGEPPVVRTSDVDSYVKLENRMVTSERG